MVPAARGITTDLLDELIPAGLAMTQAEIAGGRRFNNDAPLRLGSGRPVVSREGTEPLMRARVCVDVFGCREEDRGVLARRDAGPDHALSRPLTSNFASSRQAEAKTPFSLTGTKLAAPLLAHPIEQKPAKGKA